MTDFDLKIDSETGQLYAEDPETGDRQPVPFDEIDVNNAGVGSLNPERASSNISERTADYIVYEGDEEIEGVNTSNSEVEYSGDRGGAVLSDIFDDHIGDPLKVVCRLERVETEWREIFLDSNQALIGDGRGQTVIQPADEPDEVADNIGLINIYGGVDGREEWIENWLVEGITVDGRKDDHSLSGEYEGVEFDGCRDGIFRDGHVKDCPADGVDIDDAEETVTENVIIENCDDGYHCSVGAHENVCRNVKAVECNTGFTQQNGARANVYVNPTAVDNNRHFDINEETFDGDDGGGAFVVAPRLIGSDGGSSNFDGVTGGLDTFPFLIRDDFRGHDQPTERQTVGQYHEYAIRRETPKTAMYRPNFAGASQDFSIESGELVLEGTDSSVEVDVLDSWNRGSIEFVYEPEFVLDSTGPYVRLIPNSGNFLRVRVRGFHEELVVEEEGGDGQFLVWDGLPQDDEEHTVRVEYDGAGGWELFFDEDSVADTSTGPDFDNELDTYQIQGDVDMDVFFKFFSLE